MNQKKRGKQKIEKSQEIISQEGILKKNDCKEDKSVTKNLKKAKKQAARQASRSNKYQNDQHKDHLNKTLKQTQKEGPNKILSHESDDVELDQVSYQDEDQIQDQVQVQDQDQIQQKIQLDFGSLDQKFQKQVNDKKKCKLQSLSLYISNEKKQDFQQYLKNLQQEKQIYQLWLEEMSKLFKKYQPYLEISLDPMQAQKQMTEKNQSRGDSCKKKETEIINLQTKRSSLKKLLESRLKTIVKNERRDEKLQKKLMENFYNKQKYMSKQAYIDMISQTSQIIMKMNQKQNTFIQKDRGLYVKKLKFILYTVGRQYLFQQDTKKKLQNYNAWKYFKQIILEILQTKRINFLAFELQNEEFDFSFKKMFIDASFVNFKETYKNTKELNTQKINYKPLSQLSIRKSHIYYQDDLQRLEEVVQIVKKSWYIRSHIAYYIADRQAVFQQLNSKKRKPKKLSCKTDLQILESVEKLMEKAKVYFIDYAMVSVNGITLTTDPLKQYPIFINLFSFFEGKKVSIGYFQSYTLFLLVHELAHSVIRNYDWIQSGESSNPFNFIKDNKKDGGWMLEHLIFGGAVEVYSEKDYENVKGLLKLKNCPSYIQYENPINQQFYKNHQQKIQKLCKQQILLHQKIVKNEKKNDNYFKKAQSNHQQKRLLIEIQQQQKHLGQKIDEYTKEQKPKQKSMEKFENKKSNHKYTLSEQKFKSMQGLISCYGKRKLQSTKSNDHNQLRSLRIGKHNQSESYLQPLNSHCGTHYK